jgi:DNA-binding PadR family transcriptional regulator
MRKQGWISVKPGRDRREHLFSLTAAGKRQMAKAKPHWDLAESRLRNELGERGWKEMKETVSLVTKGAIKVENFPQPR